MALAFPRSYQDPLYENLATQAEQAYGLPSGILNAIRMRGERSNADQVSSAGARTPYQFIPSTRQAFLRKYNVDPWADPSQATNAAAIHLSEDFKRTGSWDEAIARYYGGQRPPPASYKYQARVGDFDKPDTSKPYYTGADEMPQSLYPVVNNYDPLAPEPPRMPAPIPESLAPSANVAAASPMASHKRGGILGALESVFMPDPGTRWAGALRDGLFNAKESQQNYLTGQASKLLQLQEANAKLKRLQQQGEFTVVGNNVFHVKPDGTHELISGPTSADDKLKLVDLWKQRRDANPQDPTLPLLEGLIFGGDYGRTPEGSAATNTSREAAARARANATLGAARIRGPAGTSINVLPALPPGAKVIH